MKEYFLTLKDSVSNLADHELIRAKGEYGEFNSRHEAYAVLKEEIEEMQEELNDLDISLTMIWEGIKNDNESEDMQNTLGYAEKEITSALAEGVQVLAMVRKFKEFEFEDAELKKRSNTKS